jgi:hypothetical protein
MIVIGADTHKAPTQQLVPENAADSRRFGTDTTTTEPPRQQGFRTSGARGARTPDLLHAI